MRIYLTSMDFVSTQTPSSRVLCLNEGTGLTCCSSQLQFLPRCVCIYLSLDGSDFWKGDEGLGVVGGLQQRDQTEQEASTPLYLCRGTRVPTDAHAKAAVTAVHQHVSLKSSRTNNLELSSDNGRSLCVGGEALEAHVVPLRTQVSLFVQAAD